MDIGELAKQMTAMLIPVLPYVVKTSDKFLEEVGKGMEDEAVRLAKVLWTKIRPKIESKPSILDAVKDVAEHPTDSDAQGALRLQIKKLLTDDKALADEVREWWKESGAANLVVTATGERSVAIGGDVRGTSITTGDQSIHTDKK